VDDFLGGLQRLARVFAGSTAAAYPLTLQIAILPRRPARESLLCGCHPLSDLRVVVGGDRRYLCLLGPRPSSPSPPIGTALACGTSRASSHRVNLEEQTGASATLAAGVGGTRVDCAAGVSAT
jgi:hypothetical protein